MIAAQSLLNGIATVLWPIIVIALIFTLRPALIAIIESAKSRRFTVKIGGQELTMEEANGVQQKLIADLQTQVAEIQNRIGSGIETPKVAAVTAAAVPSRNRVKVLWVDDNPKNNSYFIQQLWDGGVKVDVARSTREAADLFSSQKYDFVISDMGRLEQETYNPTAGLDLIRLIRRTDRNVPIVVYSSAKALREHQQEISELGGSAWTSSPTELSRILNFTGLEN